MFAVDGVKVTSLPMPRFIEKFTYPESNHMKPSYHVIYELYKAPNALQKVKDWAKAQRLWMGFHARVGKQQRYGSKTVEFTRAGSQVSFVAFYTTSGRLYLWSTDDGAVLDVSEGFTSKASGPNGSEGAPYYEKLVRVLEGIAR